MNNGEISGTGKPEMNCLELDQGWFAKKRAAFRFAVASSLRFEIGAQRRHYSRNLPSIHRGLFCQTLPNYFNLRWRISPMRVGLALPRLSFITWPLRKLRRRLCRTGNRRRGRRPQFPKRPGYETEPGQ